MSEKPRASVRGITLAGFGIAVLWIVGCSVSPASRLTLFPSGHQLLDSAKAVRDAAGPAPAVPRELEKQLLPLYVVEPGDVLFVQMAELDSPVRLPGDQPVLLDGTINLGAYGLYVAAGKTVETIEREIRALVAEKIKKDPGFVSARIVTRASKVYYVLGEVNAPGVFPVTGRETVLDGLIAAGGLNDRASRRNIILVRPTHPDSCRIVLPVCYRQIVQLGDTTTNYQLAPGDRIFVPSRNFHDQFRGRRRESNCACGGPQTSCLQGGSCGNPAGVLPVSVPVPYAPAPQLESLPAPVVAPK